MSSSTTSASTYSRRLCQPCASFDASIWYRQYQFFRRAAAIALQAACRAVFHNRRAFSSVDRRSAGGAIRINASRRFQDRPRHVQFSGISAATKSAIRIASLPRLCLLNHIAPAVHFLRAAVTTRGRAADGPRADKHLASLLSSLGAMPFPGGKRESAPR